MDIHQHQQQNSQENKVFIRYQNQRLTLHHYHQQNLLTKTNKVEN